MKFQLIALIATIAEVQGGRVPICKKVDNSNPPIYRVRKVKAARAQRFIDDADSKLGRCGPTNCAELCKDYKDYAVAAAGRVCECLN